MEGNERAFGVLDYYEILGLWFSVQLLVCVVLYCLQQPRRKHFVWRLLLALVVYFGAGIGVSVLFPVTVVQNDLFILGQLAYYMIVWCVLLAGVAFCFDIGLEEILFIGIGGYATQHIGYSLSMFVRYFSEENPSEAVRIFCFELLPFLIVGGLVWFFLIRKGNRQMKKRDLRFLPLAAVMCASCVILSAISSVPETQEGLFLSRIVCRSYAVLCCVLTLVLLFGITRENELEREKETMEILLHAETEQHRINKENIDIINIKCHDLKHQIALLREADERPAREEAIAEIEQAVQFYDANIRTGNDTLDLVLTQKSMLCRSQHIALNCIADGKSLDFLNPSDLLSLFGNALDNAIEATQSFPEEERQIDLRVSRQGRMVFVHLENPCGELTFAEGLPQTTKEDKAYHGFGVRSIRYIVGKYAGDVQMYVQEGRFNLDILLPPPKEEHPADKKGA